jgi:hypothetical protein
LPTVGGLYAGEFEKGGHDLRMRVEGQLVFNTATMAVKAAGAGLAFVWKIVCVSTSMEGA